MHYNYVFSVCLVVKTWYTYLHYTIYTCTCACTLVETLITSTASCQKHNICFNLQLHLHVHVYAVERKHVQCPLRYQSQWQGIIIQRSQQPHQSFTGPAPLPLQRKIGNEGIYKPNSLCTQLKNWPRGSAYMHVVRLSIDPPLTHL